jgi:hypothetical protein
MDPMQRKNMMDIRQRREQKPEIPKRKTPAMQKSYSALSHPSHMIHIQAMCLYRFMPKRQQNHTQNPKQRLP